MSKRKEEEEAAATPFTLKNAGSGFEGRKADVFGGLDVLEQQHISHEEKRTDLEDFADLTHDGGDDDNDLVETRPSATRSGGQIMDVDHHGNGDSFKIPEDVSGNAEADIHSDKKQELRNAGRPAQFRRPSGRPPGRGRGQRSRVPEHGEEPQSWTHYSLGDIKGSDLSEKSNTKAALAFLDEQRKLREKRENEEMDLDEEDTFDVGSAACSKGLFSFAKRNKIDKSSSISDEDKSATSIDKLEKEQSSAAVVDLAISGTGAEVEGTLEEETADAQPSITKDEGTKAGFKSRKGIRRNIRARDDD